MMCVNGCVVGWLGRGHKNVEKGTQTYRLRCGLVRQFCMDARWGHKNAPCRLAKDKTRSQHTTIHHHYRQYCPIRPSIQTMSRMIRTHRRFSSLSGQWQPSLGQDWPLSSTGHDAPTPLTRLPTPCDQEWQGKHRTNQGHGRVTPAPKDHARSQPLSSFAGVARAVVLEALKGRWGPPPTTPPFPLY